VRRGGSLIRDARRRSGVSQAELARRLGTSQAAVWRWECAVVEPPWATVVRAVSACGLAVAVSLQDVDPSDWQLVQQGRDRSPAERLRDLESYSRFVTHGRAAMRRAKQHG
jgi:transcriptional regulator with XRE-family HTH domain